SGKLCLADADTTGGHAYFGEGVDVEGRSIRRAGKLQRRNPSCPYDIVHLAAALVEYTGGIHPPLQVFVMRNGGARMCSPTDKGCVFPSRHTSNPENHQSVPNF